MKEPLIENGIVVGTGSDKFEQKNPVVKWAINNFDKSISELISLAQAPGYILEVGCGEGHITQMLLDQTSAKIKAYDISRTVLDIARNNIQSDRVNFALRNILDLDPNVDMAELVVCCEVLEHLDEPRLGLQRLAECANPYAIISVPREPLFRTLNFVRGAHIRSLGNSPGHLQHWSKNRFIKFISQEFDIVETRTPVPWTVLLVRRK